MCKTDFAEQINIRDLEPCLACNIEDSEMDHGTDNDSRCCQALRTLLESAAGQGAGWSRRRRAWNQSRRPALRR